MGYLHYLIKITPYSLLITVKYMIFRIYHAVGKTMKYKKGVYNYKVCVEYIKTTLCSRNGQVHIQVTTWFIVVPDSNNK